MSTRSSTRVRKPVKRDDDEVEEDEDDTPVKKPAARGRKKKTDEDSTTTKATSKAKGKRKATEAADDDGETQEEKDGEKDEKDGEEDGTETPNTIKKKLKETKKNAADVGSSSKSIDIDFNLFTKSINDHLAIANISTISREEFELEFDRIADVLLNKAVVFVHNKPHRLCEIEFYCNGHNHPDEFAHGSDLQKTRGNWYFHLQGKNTYKNGSYKGLDLTFGEPTIFGGILLRAIQPIGGDLVEGPSLTVDHVLATNSADDIKSLVDTFDLKAENLGQANKTHPLWVGVAEDDLPFMERREVVKSARVGLTLKRFKEGKEGYFGRGYRYLTNPDQIKKGKHYMVVGLHKQGKTPEQISKQIKSTLPSVTKLIAAYEKGKKKNWRDYIDATLSADLCCEALGACDK